MTAMSARQQSDKCDARVTSCTSATERNVPSNSHLWLHVRILYGIVLLLAIGCSISIWLCLREVHKLRVGFRGEILPNGLVEFGSPRRYNGNTWNLNAQEEDALEEEEDDDTMTSYTTESMDTPTGDRADNLGYEVVEGHGGHEEDLIRVKRRAPKSQRRSRKKKRDKPRENPMYFVGDSPPTQHEAMEGSGDGSMNNWVWLKAYSRIPVEALTQFCKSSNDFCPPGRAGPPGVPGIQGIQGDDGAKGDNGNLGYPGMKGDTGTDGEKGEAGEYGIPGMNGEKGDPGINGTDGDQGPAGPTGLPGLRGPAGRDGLHGTPGEPGVNGTTGRRGKRGKLGHLGAAGDAGVPGTEGPRGHKGPKGDTGIAGLDADSTNCTCPPGPYATGPPGPSGLPGSKGQKGDPGSSNLVLDTTIATTPTTTPEPTPPPSTTVEPTIDPRSSECRIRMVGKPLFQRYTGTYWGAWMKDTYRKTSPDAYKFWFTRHFTGKSLYEYVNQDEFRANRETKVYDLDDLYFGTGHTIYDGAFIYHKSGTRDLIKFDLHKEAVVGSVEIPDAAYQGKNYVYSTEYNYFDLASDENGLWVIYSADNEDMSLLVSKINPYSMEIEKTWNITVAHQTYGNGFITCGVLYLIKNTHAKTTLIDFAYDLYTKQQLTSVRLQFTNPFQMNNMISYNPLEGRIYSWDKGNQLTYPLLN